MCDAAFGAIDDEKARLIAACRGFLRDELRGKRVVEKIGGENGHDVVIKKPGRSL